MNDSNVVQNRHESEFYSESDVYLVSEDDKPFLPICATSSMLVKFNSKFLSISKLLVLPNHKLISTHLGLGWETNQKFYSFGAFKKKL